MHISQLLDFLSADFFKYNDDLIIQQMLDHGILSKQDLNERNFKRTAATEEAILAAENRLGISLPPSYRGFLQYSNGFGHISSFMDHILPIEMVDWVYETDREWVAMLQGDYWEYDILDEDYFVYGEEQQSDQTFRPRYLKKSLKICDWYDGTIILLNSEIQHEGEWEVINYATWNVGATRHRSFLEFLIGTHETNQEINT